MATSRTLTAYVLLLSIVLLSCPDLYKCERDMSDSRIGAAAVETRETVDGKRCAIRYIIGEHQWLLG
ncbi:hypothetical protein ACET3Z_014656 [Daucus carota]